jgi:hypothetical protein
MKHDDRATSRQYAVKAESGMIIDPVTLPLTAKVADAKMP